MNANIFCSIGSLFSSDDCNDPFKRFLGEMKGVWADATLNSTKSS